MTAPTPVPAPGKSRSKKKYPPHLLVRLRKLRQRMRKASLDAVLITYPRDIRYLTNFIGEDSWMFVSSREVIILSDSRFEEEIAINSLFCTAVIRTGAMHLAAAAQIQDHRWRKVGIQTEHLTVQLHQALAKEVGPRKLKPITNWLIEQRAIKDATELRHIRRAIRIQQDAFEQLRTEIKTGMTEQQVTARLEFLMRDAGGEGPSFPTIVAAGTNSSLPHAIPGAAKIKRGEPILIDFGTVVGGYCSDLTRVIHRGPLKRDLREVYRVVLEAQQAAIRIIKPGVKLKDVDKVARKIIDEAGYGDRFGHGLGHGIGLDIHELPTLSGRSKGTLQPGHVVTVEPGIYLPGVGGVRIEDDVLVTKTGRSVLSNLKRDAESAII